MIEKMQLNRLFKLFRLAIIVTLYCTISVSSENHLSANSSLNSLLLVQLQPASTWTVFNVDKDEIVIVSDCNCSIEYLTITNSAQKEFPSNIFSELIGQVAVFEMVGRGVEKLNATDLKNANNLVSLNMSGNEIAKLSSKSFAEAPQLQIIDFSHNQIILMDSDVFEKGNISDLVVPNDGEEKNENAIALHTQSSARSTKVLKEIYLHNNYLTYINSEWFKTLDDLKVLTLGNNFLTELDAKLVFPNNRALTILSFKNNNFTSMTNLISENLFLNGLQDFDVSNNPQILDSDIRINSKYVDISETNVKECFIADNVQIIKANQNKLTTTSIKISNKPNDKLLELHLAHNFIDSDEFLDGLIELEVIDLSHNLLTKLTQKTLAKMFYLKQLNLSNNKFATIDLSFMRFTPNLYRLDISYNQLGGEFEINGFAMRLTSLNLAGNNYTAIGKNIKLRAPKLKSIDINDIWFTCSHLTSILLFLNTLQISPIVRAKDAKSKTAGNINGISCYENPPCSDVADNENIEIPDNPVAGTANETVEVDIPSNSVKPSDEGQSTETNDPIEQPENDFDKPIEAEQIAQTEEPDSNLTNKPVETDEPPKAEKSSETNDLNVHTPPISTSNSTLN